MQAFDYVAARSVEEAVSLLSKNCDGSRVLCGGTDLLAQLSEGRLRTQLLEFIDENTPRLRDDDEQDVQPTLGFQRVLQRAVFHVQSSGKKEVAASNFLVAIFGEKQSHAIYLLEMHVWALIEI